MRLNVKLEKKMCIQNMGREKLTRIDDRDFDYWFFIRDSPKRERNFREIQNMLQIKLKN